MPAFISTILSSYGVIGYTGSVGSGFTGSAGSALTNWTVKTANYSAVSGDRIVANTAAQSFYITLPSTPSTGHYVKITDGNDFSVNPLKILSNGSTIQNQNIDLNVDIKSVDLEFLYTGSTWQVISTFGPKGYTGSTGNFTSWTYITGNYTAVNNERLIADTIYTGSFTITLPANPLIGSCIQITDGGNFSANPLTVNPNGSTVENINDTVIIDTGGVDLEFFYANGTWRVISTFGPNGYTGSRGITGYTGSQGDLGYAGSIGFTGSRGAYDAVGFTGSRGIDGIIGVDGYTGSQGNLGYSGSSGFTGSAGPIGFTGSRGDIAMVLAVSDEATALSTGTAKLTFRAPYAMTLTQIPRASVATASTSGLVTVDINENGTSILGANKLSIDANEKTSTTAATPTTLADSSIADDAEITIDIDAAGTGAKGLKVTIYYNS